VEKWRGRNQKGQMESALAKCELKKGLAQKGLDFLHRFNYGGQFCDVTRKHTAISKFNPIY
jgi:hypothetical protein